MTWMERWVGRAQRKSDERDARYQRREAGKRAGQIPPSFMDKVIAHWQAAVDPRIASDAAWVSLVQQVTAVCGNPNWIVSGPDGIEVSVGEERGPHHSRVAYAYMPSDWSVTVTRQFPDGFEALSYLVHLATRIRAEGVKALRQENGEQDASDTLPVTCGAWAVSYADQVHTQGGTSWRCASRRRRFPLSCERP